MHLLSDTCNLLSLGSKFYSRSIVVRNSKLSFNCLKKIQDLGFISGFTILSQKKVKIFFKYNHFYPILRSAYTLSVPSKDVSLKKKKIQNVSRNNLNGFIIISTDCGLATDIECVFLSIGGKALIGLS